MNSRPHDGVRCVDAGRPCHTKHLIRQRGGTAERGWVARGQHITGIISTCSSANRRYAALCSALDRDHLNSALPYRSDLCSVLEGRALHHRGARTEQAGAACRDSLTTCSLDTIQVIRGLGVHLGTSRKNSTAKQGHGIVVPVNLSRPGVTAVPLQYRMLLEEHARFLVNFVAILERSSGSENSENRKQVNKLPVRPTQRPQLDTFAAKSHWMDNVRARKMCDEMLHLEDSNHPLPETGKANTGQRNATFMRTLQLSMGQQVNVLKMNNNPEVSIGGYFIISQMLSYIKALVSLDLSSNNLTAAAARVLSLGLKSNHSIQELRMKDNTIGSEGATSMSNMLKVNNTVLLMDLRMNCIRGAGVCVLADAVSENKSLTELDMRWNYAGECSDFVEMALVDLKDFCFRNMMFALEKTKPATPAPDPKNTKFKELSFNDDDQKVFANGSVDSSPQTTPSLPESSAEKIESFYNTLDLFADQEPIGKLEVTIISARNLPQVIWTSGKDGEFMGLPQAYCTFTLNKQTTTTAIMRKDWAPVWNHTVSIDVRQVWQVCSLKVMHSKTLHCSHLDDYIIGNVNLPVGAVINWRGVMIGADRTWRACHRPLQVPPPLQRSERASQDFAVSSCQDTAGCCEISVVCGSQCIRQRWHTGNICSLLFVLCCACTLLASVSCRGGARRYRALTLPCAHWNRTIDLRSSKLVALLWDHKTLRIREGTCTGAPQACEKQSCWRCRICPIP